jgi:hypothetical protein
MAVVSSTAAVRVRQLVMFIVDKVVDEDRRMLLANELESITFPDGTPQALGPAARDAFGIFEDLCLLGTVTESVRNSHNLSTSTRRLLSN